MANNNDKKVLNVPALRFPEFTEEWKKCTIKDYGEVITGNTPPTKNIEYYSNGSYLWASPADLGLSKHITSTKTKLSLLGLKKTRTIPQGSILVTCIGSTIGKMGMATETMSTNQQINSVIVNDSTNNDFAYYAILNAFPRYLSEVGVQAVPILSKSNFEKLPNHTTTKEEQRKLGYFLNLLDERIATQNKIIEDLKKLKSAIIHRCYSSQTNMIPLSELLKQCSDRNRSGSDLQVLSVSNKYGFIAQSNQFEDREVASDDTSNYKVVKKGMFAYNPARINVGSIALYEMDGNGIVSPMYVCFTTKSELLPSYLKYYFASQTFKHEMYKRLEGSVRLCLTFEELCNIEIHLPSIEQQKNISKYISKIENNLSLVDSIFSKYQQQRRYLLSQMFI